MLGTAQFNIVGTLTKDPEIRQYTHEDEAKQLCFFAVAVNSKAGKEKEETVDFFECVLHGKPRVEVFTKYVKKGDHIYLTGRLRHERWETEEGQKRSGVKCVVEDFVFLPNGKNGNDAMESEAAAPISKTNSMAGSKSKKGDKK